jgi:hypothetical protein
VVAAGGSDGVDVRAGVEGTPGAADGGDEVGFAVERGQPLRGYLVAHEHGGDPDGEHAGGDGGERDKGEYASPQRHRVLAL